MRKTLIRYIAIAITLVLLLVFARQMKWIPSLSDIFSSKPVVIDNTPVLIKEINELSQLTTVTAYDEVVADSFRVGKNALLPGLFPIPGVLPLSMDRIVLVGKGKVTAGIDLKKIKEEDIYIKKDSVSLRLPAAEVFDAILNPADFTTFAEDGDWTPEAVTQVKIKAREKMIRRALQQGLLSKADAKGKQLMENFLSGVGFSKIHFQ